MSHNRLKTFILILLIPAAFVACNQSPEIRKQRAFERGKQRLKAKDYARAILEFKNATRADPRDAEAHYQLALAYQGSQDIRSAVASLHQATELNPAHSNAQIKLAEILSGTRDTSLLKDAALRMENVLASNPENPEALSALAYAEFKLGEFEDAEKHLAQAVENGPTNLKAAAGLAQMKLAQQKVHEAEDILKRAADQKPPAATPVIVLAGFYLSQNRLSDARREFIRALEVEKDNPIALLYLGNLQFKAGETEEAGKTFKRLSALPDKQYRAAYGVFLFQTGKREDGVKELERLVAGDPEDRLTRRRLLSAYLMMGRTGDAERMLGAALKKNPKDTDALLGRSRILLSSGKHAEAQSDLSQIISYEPNSAEAHYFLAQLHRMRGNAKSYRQELTEAVRLNPELLNARVELSRVLLAANAGKSAVDLMNATPEEQKRNTTAVAQRNWALLATGSKEDARKGVVEGLAIGRTPDLLLQDAVLKLEQGDLAPARASLEESLKKYPHEIRALDLLARTYLIQKQPDQALRRIREHAAAHPESARVQQYLGTSLQRKEAITEARAAFKAAKSADASFWAADISTATLDAMESKFETARDILLPLVSHPSAGFQARSLLAAVEDKSGNKSAALEHYRKLVEQQPDSVFALNQLAYLLVEHANSPDEALKLAERAKELAPDNATVDDTLGWILYKKGLHIRAVQHLELSVKRQANATRHAHLAIAYAASGDSTRGLEHLQAAVKLDPNVPEIVIARKILADGK